MFYGYFVFGIENDFYQYKDRFYNLLRLFEARYFHALRLVIFSQFVSKLRTYIAEVLRISFLKEVLYRLRFGKY